MVCFVANKRQCTIAGMIGLLMLLASLLPDLNLALAQSCPTPTVTLSASSGSPGDVLTVQGEGWLPGGTVTITATGPERLDVLTGQVPDSGTWEADINVIRAPPGNYVFVFSEIMDRCDLRATVPFTINGPTISLDLTESPPGTEVTVQGSGWIAGDIVSIQFAEPGNEVAQATVGDDGSFTTTFTVPSDAQSGEQQVIAVDANDSNWQTDTVFQVTVEGAAPL
jgi:hypothetical protein